MNIPIISFNAGELSPQIDSRSDVKKYSSGCRDLDNMLPRIYGSAERRPGTKYIASTKNGDEKIRLVSFQYSDTIAYICEFGPDYIRFFYNGGRVTGTTTTPTAWAAGTAYIIGDFATYTDDIVYRRLVAGTTATAPDSDFTNWIVALLDDDDYPICETPSPYQEGDLFEIQFRQSADVMWDIHNEYASRKLTRTTATTFDLSTIDFTSGPFMLRNDLANDDDVTITPSATTGDITLTASSAVFDPQHISLPGALFKLTQARATTETSGSKTSPTGGVIGDPLTIKGTFTFNTHGTWTGTVKLQRNKDEEGWETYRTYLSANDRNIQFTGTEEEDNVQYRIEVTSIDAGTINADLTVNNSTQDGIARITVYISPTVVNATVLTDFASTTASKRWAEGSWSAYRGYPAAFTFFEERAVYAGTTAAPQTVWLSESGDFEDFDAGLNNSDSFSLVMSADKMNAIRWLSALEALMLGTIGGEWRIRATALDEEITPTNYNVRIQTTRGSKKIQPMAVGDATLFIDYVGRKIRELTFSDEKQKFVSPDLSALAEHITLTGITCMAYQRNPDSIVWCVLANGELISMTYERDQDVVAWARHPIGGNFGGNAPIVESVAVVPGTTEDEVWISVKRTIDSSTVRYIEQLQPRVAVDIEDSFFVDSGLKFDGGDPVTITLVTATDPPVITVSSWPVDGDGNDLDNGDQIYITGIIPETHELNGNVYTMRNADTVALTFTLESI